MHVHGTRRNLALLLDVLVQHILQSGFKLTLPNSVETKPFVNNVIILHITEIDLFI